MPTGSTSSKIALLEPYTDLMGTVPDAKIAAMVGVHVRTVFNYRMKKHIAGYKRGQKKSTSPVRIRPSKIDLFAHLVGKVPDRIVAQKSGSNINTVRNWRVRHGVAAAQTDTAEVATPPSDTPVSAWQVTFASSQERIVLAPTAEKAARQAGEAKLGTVTGLRQLETVVL